MSAKTRTKTHDAMRLAMTLHNPPVYPHWSEGVDWPADRWDPMANAPRAGYPILNVRGRTAEGTIVEPIHYACGDGDGLMPPFDGWFAPDRGGEGFHEVRPVEWQPLRAAAAIGEAMRKPAPKLCDPCQQTGLMHCADPANCKGTP